MLSSEHGIPYEGGAHMNEDLPMLIATHRFFTNMEPQYIEIFIDLGSKKHYRQGDFLGLEGNASTYFFALLHGRVSIESSQPGIGTVNFQSLHGGDIVGWSWAFPPYEWVFDAKAQTDVETLAFNASQLRLRCEADHSFGYALMKRLAQVMTIRVKITRLQLLDLYNQKRHERRPSR
jgi:CRP-like cAMP-binding protein